jgi:hypothetical protein
VLNSASPARVAHLSDAAGPLNEAGDERLPRAAPVPNPRAAMVPK